jgi:hypothetical protein
MSRVSRIPYHQNVYDLLQIEPGECPAAKRMIEEHEAKHGPLPASVREWYLVPHIVELDAPDDLDSKDGEGTIWHDSLPSDGGERYCVRSLYWVLGSYSYLARTGGIPVRVEVLNTWGFYTWTWRVHFDYSDDPPVWVTADAMDQNAPAPKLHSPTFSEFISKQFTKFFSDPSCPGYLKRSRGESASPLNRLWLRTPSEPFQPPVIDFLIDRFGEPRRTPRAGDVTIYAFAPAGGTIRVTADEPTLTGGLSAWWVHAETPERLAEFAELLLPWGTLRETLRADTEPAREVLKRARRG